MISFNWSAKDSTLGESMARGVVSFAFMNKKVYLFFQLKHFLVIIAFYHSNRRLTG